MATSPGTELCFLRSTPCLLPTSTLPRHRKNAILLQAVRSMSRSAPRILCPCNLRVRLSRIIVDAEDAIKTYRIDLRVVFRCRPDEEPLATLIKAYENYAAPISTRCRQRLG